MTVRVCWINTPLIGCRRRLSTLHFTMSLNVAAQSFLTSLSNLQVDKESVGR